MRVQSALALALVVLIAGCQNSTSRMPREAETRIRSATTQQTDSAADEDLDDSEAALFHNLDETFGRKGEIKDGVYRLVTPRSDLMVKIEDRDVPTGAFLESDFRFWRCPCGKLLVNGQFVVADYEANDVIDEIQLGHMKVASLGPLLIDESPRLMLIRFQGEGRSRPLARALKSALGYTGDARHAPIRRIDNAPATD